MRAAGKKLKGSRGASIIIALGLVLICAMVSSVIVLAAATGSSRTVYRTEQQQKYLAISSAAELLQEELALLGTFTASASMYSYNCATYPSYNGDPDEIGLDDIYILGSTHSSDTAYGSYTVFNELGGAFADLVEAACKYIADPDELPAASVNFVKSFTVSSGDERLPDVSCTFHMYNDYSIIIILENPDTDFKLTISADARTNDENNGSGVVTSSASTNCQHTTATKVLDEDTGSYTTNVIEQSFGVVQYTKTLEISWFNIMLLKGEVYG